MKESNGKLGLDLQGKKVVVLGGSSGIGLATAKIVAATGGKVIIVSSNRQRVDSAVNEVGTNATGQAIDLTNEAQVQQLFNNIGNFDHLVFTAGEHLHMDKLSDTAMDTAHKFFEVRYWGAVMAVKYATPYINAGGSVVLTSGTAAKRPGAGWALGASICAAMEGFTRAMAVELSPIRVNLVIPGIVRTNLWNNVPDADRAAMYDSYGKSLLVKRIGEAEDIAKTYLYLMTQQYSTGQAVIVDGGGLLS